MKIRSNGKVGGSRLGSMLDSNVEPQTAATFKLKLKTSTNEVNGQQRAKIKHIQAKITESTNALL